MKAKEPVPNYSFQEFCQCVSLNSLTNKQQKRGVKISERDLRSPRK